LICLYLVDYLAKIVQSFSLLLAFRTTNLKRASDNVTEIIN